MTIQMQEEQKCSSCFLTELQQLAGKGDSMAKFLNYEDRLEIESGLKEHMTFTELERKIGRDRTTITKEIRTIPSNRIPVMEVIRTIPANTERRAGEKKCVEQMIAGIRW